MTTNNSIASDILYVSWQHPTTRQWFIIGRLTQSSEGFQFTYTRGASKAYSAGFQALAAFPDFYKTYQQPTLFATFHNRLLPASRPDYADFLSWLAVSADTAAEHPLALLDRTNGSRKTDSVELFRRPSIESDGSLTTCFFIRGLHYRSNEVQFAVERLKPGTSLYMAFDVQNPQDPEAILLRTAEDIVVPGYLPRHLVPLTSELLRLAPERIKVSIEKVNASPAPVQLRVMCRLHATHVPTDLSALHESMYDEMNS